MLFKLLLLQLGFTCSTAADKLRFILLDSQCSFFFFWLFLLQKAEICWHIWKISISCLLWSDRWKLHGEIQRHAIVITYMFMTIDRCEDTLVLISPLQHVSNDVQVYQCIFRGLRIAQIPRKKVQHSESEWYAHDLRCMFKVTSSSPPLSLINFFFKDDNQRRDFSSGYCS